MAISPTTPGVLGVVAGGTVFVLLLVPLLVWQTRAYGRVTLVRLLGAAVASVYLAALAAYTLLPSAPIGTDTAAWCVEHGFRGVNLDPLQFVHDIAKEARGRTGLAAIANIAVVQLVLNVVLFVPWGVLARGFLGWSRGATVASAALCSLFIETTQATGVFGLIPCSYRYGDVDDLLTNTLGGLVGAVLAPLLLSWMPSHRELARSRSVPRPVTARRRWLGMLLDWSAFVVAVGIVELGYAVVRLVAGLPYPGGPRVLHGALVGLVPAALVFVLPAFVGSGASMGQRIVWLAPRWPGRPEPIPPLGRRLLRVVLPSAAWAVATVLGLIGSPVSGPSPVLLAVSVLLVVVAVVVVVATPDRRGVSGLVSGCRYVDVREGAAVAEPGTAVAGRPEAGWPDAGRPEAWAGAVGTVGDAAAPAHEVAAGAPR